MADPEEQARAEIAYSPKYHDDVYEYRHVIVPKLIARRFKRDHLMTEEEWRGHGIQQSRGWVHYMHHRPEPHVLLFRRPLVKDSPPPHPPPPP